jgi:hypothetical protein
VRPRRIAAGTLGSIHTKAIFAAYLHRMQRTIDCLEIGQYNHHWWGMATPSIYRRFPSRYAHLPAVGLDADGRRDRFASWHMADTPDFHPERPKNPECPPKDAEFVHGVVWRGVKQDPPVEKDFLSHAEQNLPNCDKQNCEHWGLSVWVSEAAVDHARGLHDYVRRWHIASGKLEPTDGKIMPTPRYEGDTHHTFWKFHGHSVLAKFSIVMPPLPKKKKSAA